MFLGPVNPTCDFVHPFFFMNGWMGWMDGWISCSSPTPMYQEIRKYLSQGPPSPLLFQSTDIDTLLWMIPRISFKKESTLLLLDPDEDPSQWPIELKIVQDADRLDAMGAIGLARCFVYGGAHHRPIYTDPTTFSFQRTLALNSTEVPPPSSMDHVYEKLLKIKTFMKTKTGKQLAEHRHQFLEQFVEEFWKEIQVGERDPLPVHEQKTDVDL
ncbi:hypothetical protein HMI54_006696 [Coelomomyces lativittatus]|nr:hypothetical protein HMI55_002515 [Coelomomyces lativittatus]KAJ1504720.1 hypothetical protein HMI54_006696 [Coelomomyces lativittatus]